MLRIYHNPRCSKSRETLKIIEQNPEKVQIIEYLKLPPTEDELRDIINKLGIRPEQLIRKNENLFKENYKGKEYSDDEWIHILAGNPILIERPIVLNEERAVIGRPPEKVRELL